MNDVPDKYFPDLEHFFTRCFSLPNAVSFVIQETDRFLTGRPDPYANQQVKELFSIDLTEQQHIIMGLESATKVVGQLVLAVQSEANTACIPRVWISTRDVHGNPCPRLVDIWMPRVMFNRKKCILLIAPHGVVSLERALEPYHAPCHPPYAHDLSN
jgi:hypothetical protein